MTFYKWTCGIGFFIVLSMLVTSCYTRTDGCLDPEATNYSIIADDDCDDCCTYPTIKLSVFHQYKDTTLFLEDTLVNNLGQEYAIIKYVYFLSDFRMQTEDGEIHEVSDSIQINVENGTQYVKDDIIRVSRSVFSYNLGTVIFDGLGEELSFKVGVPEKLNEDNFTSPVSGHPLTSDPDSMYMETEYVFQRVLVAKGEEFKDTVVYDIKGSSNLQEVSVLFPDEKYESLRGIDKTIIIEALHNKWFDEVDFEVMSKEQIEEQMASQSALMFKARL